MPVNRRLLVSYVALAALAWPSAHANAQEAATTAECAQAYEQGQEQRKSGQLVTARSSLQLCARDECPDFIRADCATWYGEVQSEVPTLVFAARSQGRDLADVRITLGERVLSSRIDGQVVELDPGEYDFRFEAAKMQTLTQHFVIARGERNRLIQVDMAPIGVSSAVDAPEVAAPVTRSRLLPGVFAGIGVAGLAGFAGFGAWGRSTESTLEDSCAPHCSQDRISGVKTKYLLADVSLGVGVASLALGAYFFFRDEEPKRAPSGLDVEASASHAAVTYGGAF
jgi:hypothetical protein